MPTRTVMKLTIVLVSLTALARQVGVTALAPGM